MLFLNTEFTKIILYYLYLIILPILLFNIISIYVYITNNNSLCIIKINYIKHLLK